MNKYIIIFIISLFFLQCKENKTNVPQTKNKEVKRDTAFFYCENIFDDNCKKSNKKEANVYRIINKKDIPYLVITNYISKNNKVLSKGQLINFAESKPKKAKYSGKWFYYGDGDKGIYKIGNYKDGLKDGIWYEEYEDSIPKLQYYKNGLKTAFKDSIIITDNNNKRIAFGKGITIDGLPIGQWFFLLNNGNIISKREFFKEKNDVIVKFTNTDVKSNLVIGKGSFNSSLDEWFFKKEKEKEILAIKKEIDSVMEWN